MQGSNNQSNTECQSEKTYTVHSTTPFTDLRPVTVFVWNLLGLDAELYTYVYFCLAVFSPCDNLVLVTEVFTGYSVLIVYLVTSFLLLPELFSMTMVSAETCWYLEQGGRGRTAIAITLALTSTTRPPEYRHTSAWLLTSCSCSDRDGILHTETRDLHTVVLKNIHVIKWGVRKDKYNNKNELQ